MYETMYLNQDYYIMILKQRLPSRHFTDDFVKGNIHFYCI